MIWNPHYYICIYTPQLCCAVVLPTCTTVAILKYFILKRLVDQICQAHRTLEVLQSPLILCVYPWLLLLPCTLIYISLILWLILESVHVLVLTCTCLYNKMLLFLFYVYCFWVIIQIESGKIYIWFHFLHSTYHSINISTNSHYSLILMQNTRQALPFTSK